MKVQKPPNMGRRYDFLQLQELYFYFLKSQSYFIIGVLLRNPTKTNSFYMIILVADNMSWLLRFFQLKESHLPQLALFVKRTTVRRDESPKKDVSSA